MVRVIRSIVVIVIFPIVTLRLLGFLQWMEWYHYDLLYSLRPPETRDERIVLVVWDEKDLQISEESTMSDDTLAFVLEKIKEQQPRVIGLDLYRDIPVSSRLLSDDSDKSAYDRLQDIFLNTPNLIGIEKVREPIINPNAVLKQQQRTYSSDIIIDQDNIVRRSFINANRDSTYIGTALGYSYLVQEGWQNSLVGKSSLALSNIHKKIVLQDLKTFDGGYINNKVGWDFLINWRKNSSLFATYSVNDLRANLVAGDAFYDKIVIIGNISSSSGDIHYAPTGKWNREQPWIYGVNIVGEVASSIISAAKDGRPLLRVAPWGMGYLLLALAAALVTSFISFFSRLSINKLYLVSILFSLTLTGLLVYISLIALLTLGWWIPIVPAVLGVWLTFLTINYEVQITREKENQTKLELLIKHLSHEIGNSTYAIRMNTEEINTKIEDANSSIDSLWDNFPIKEIHPYLRELKLNLDEIKQETPQIVLHLEKISRHRKRTKHYVELTSFRTRWHNKRKSEMTMVNDFVRQLVDTVMMELPEEHKTLIEVKQIYDQSGMRVRLDRLSLEIILSNLLENAFDTLSAKASRPNYNPTVIVKTNSTRNWIEIVVEDNGEGIPPSSVNEIFKLGVSGKPGGQGIGLFLVKELLNLEGGKIKLESRVGKGSKFIVCLPKS